jgi:hypothetical protein
MDAPGDQFFAGPAFAENEQRPIERRRARRVGEGIEKSWGLADEFGRSGVTLHRRKIPRNGGIINRYLGKNDQIIAAEKTRQHHKCSNINRLPRYLSSGTAFAKEGLTEKAPD